MRRIAAFLVGVVTGALMVLPTTGHAEGEALVECNADYWHAAYERANGLYMDEVATNYVLWNNIDLQNRKLDHKQATIDRLRAKVDRLKGNDHIGLDFTGGAG